MPKIKNILIFVAIAAVLVLIAVFVINSSSSNQSSLVSSGSMTTPTSDVPTATTGDISGASPATQDFLNTLLSVKTIKLNVDIFSDPAFISLHDSSITLVPDATTGRPNPFAQFGAEDISTSTPASTPSTGSGQATTTTPSNTTQLNPPVTPSSTQTTTPPKTP
jgi:hypothetical protein